MHEPQVYRDRAARARSRARETKLPELRRTFEIVATGYDALAKDAESLGGNPLTIVADARPIGGPPSRFERANIEGKAMSERSEELRKHARDLTRSLTAGDDGEGRKLSLSIAQACIALARNEEWLDGEIPPVVKSPSSDVPSRGG